MRSRPKLTLLALLLLLGLASAAEEKRLAIYTPQTSFTIPVVDHESTEYVSITDLLDPFGRASLTRDGKRWRLRLEAGKTLQVDFNEGSPEAKVGNRKLNFGKPFWAQNQRGYVPLSSSALLLTQFIGGSANLREAARRLFLGDAVTTYSADLQKGAPPKLVLHFSAPVNPTVATDSGHVRFTFIREPLVGATTNPQNYDDASVHSLAFAENNGASDLTVNTSAPVLVTFSDSNRTITLSPTPVVAQLAQPPKPAQPTANPTTPPATTTPATTPQPATSATVSTAAPPRFLVIIDPAHGGEDPGAALGGGLFEKDVTLAIARRVRTDLDQRGITAILLREGDTTLAVEQRAASANGSRASLYIVIHADSQGSGVRLFTARFSSPVTIPDHGFLPWNTAQAKYLDQSHNLAASLITEFESRQVHAMPLESGIRPLRNLTKPALAIEVAPPAGTIEGLTSAIYQQSVASAIGTGIANIRSSLEGGNPR